MLKNRFIMSLLVASCATAMTVQATSVVATNGGGTVTTTIGDDTNTTTTQKEVYGTEPNYQNTTSGTYKPSVQTGFTNSVITMTGGTITTRLAGFARNNPVSGNVNIEVTGGEAAAVYGGYLYSSASKHPNKYFVVSELDMPDSINIVVGGDAKVGQIRGGVNNGSPGQSTLEEKSVSVGSVAITIKDNATIGTDSSKDAIRGGGGSYCSVTNGVKVNIEGGSVIGDVYAGVRGAGTSVGFTEINVSGGTLDGNLYAGSSLDEAAGADTATVKGDTKINISGGTVKQNVFGGGYGTPVEGNTLVQITGGTVEGNVYGGAEGGTVGGNTEVVIDGGDVVGNVYGAGKGDTVKGGSKVRLLAGNVGGVVDAGGESSTVAGESVIEVGSDDKPYEGVVEGGLIGFDQIVVANNSFLTLNAGNVFDTKNHSFTLNVNNMNKAALTLGSGASIIVAPGDTITLNITSNGKLPGGKYKLIDGSAIGKGMTRATAGTVDLSGWSAGTVKVTGGLADFDDLVWDEENNILYLTLEGEAVEVPSVVVPVDPHASMDAAVLANWGVYQSAQAFTATLWGPRSNAVELAPATTTDAKGRTITVDAPAKGRTIAWATAYSHSSRIGSVGADYSIYGAALGVEHKFAKGSSVGLAFGYDWGKTKPFSTTAVDQETMHVGVYGRPVEWKLNEKSAIAIDLAAVYGHTDSEHDDFIGDWSQNSWLLDMRATYQRAINERTTASVFAGVQYYTHDDDTVDGVTIDSMQNMRLMVGAGVSYAIKRATVFGEAALHYDTLRHNPNAKENDIRYKASNPGRFGGRIGTGVSYQVKDNFNVYGTYNFSGADDSVEHNVNIGASMSF